MQRSTGITLTAIACGIGALFGLLSAGLMVVSVAVSPQELPPGTPGLAPLYFAAAVMLGFCGWAIATMLGLWKVRNWARWSVLVYSGFTLFTALSSSALMSVIPLPPTPNAPEGLMEGMRFGLIAFYGVLAVFAGALLFYFNRASVKAQFAGANPAVADPSRRPISISIIAILMLISSASVLVALFSTVPAVILGFMITGTPARAIYVAWCACFLGFGYGLLRLQPVSRVGAMALFGFGIVNSLAFVIRPGLNERAAAMLSQMPQTTAASADAAAMFTNGPAYTILMLLGCVVSVVPIWFLVKHRRAFDPLTETPAPS